MAHVLQESEASSAGLLVRTVAGVSNNRLWKAATGLLGSNKARGSVAGEDVSLSLQTPAKVVEALCKQSDQVSNPTTSCWPAASSAGRLHQSVVATAACIG